MPLEPLPSGETPAQSDTGNPEGDSFFARKLAALQAEPDPQPGTPETLNDAESATADDLSQQPLDPYHADEGTLQDDQDDADDTQDTDEDGALFSDDATPDDQPDDVDDDSTPEINWQDRYENLERKFREVTANRKAIEDDLTASAERNVALNHELEDLSRSAAVRAKLFMDLANHQVSQFENMNWDAVEPEQVAAAKQQYNQAKFHRDAMVKAFEEAETADKDAREAMRQREAHYSRSILPIKINGWSNELYGSLRDFATQRYGYTVDEFNDITDYRPILMAHDAYVAQQAADKVTKVQREKKARRPRNRNARQQPRSAEGRYQSARQAAHANPGDRQKFRELQMQKLEREQRSPRR